MMQTLQQIESRIIELVGTDLEEFKYDELSKAMKEEVKSLLCERCDILNKMFQPTEDNLALFRKVNDEPAGCCRCRSSCREGMKANESPD